MHLNSEAPELRLELDNHMQRGKERVATHVSAYRSRSLLSPHITEPRPRHVCLPNMIYLKMEDLPPFTATPKKSIPAVHQRVVDKFHSHTTRPIEYRLKQLRSLYWGLKDEEPALLEACKLDLGKSAYEAYLTEVGWVLNDIIFMSKNLVRFMKDEKPDDINLTNSFMQPRIRKDPLGSVLIIGAFNFPIQLSLGPLIGAIAAGCTAVLKPSENAANAARIMQHIISQSLDPDAYQVVQGAVPETTALLDCKWDKIFYTGSANVGKIVAKRAAETLTPVTLELGGRNPAIITKYAEPRLAARRLLWAKLMNVGQVCVSQKLHLSGQRDSARVSCVNLSSHGKSSYPRAQRRAMITDRLSTNANGTE